jgi:periplasmic copper chaperone A
LVANIDRKDLLMSRNRLRLLGGAAVAAVALLTTAGAASAHVEIKPGTAIQGVEATFSFEVLNEQESASTTKLQVQLPADQPLGVVAVSRTRGGHSR